MNTVCHDVMYLKNNEIREFVEELIRNDYMLHSYKDNGEPYVSLTRSVNRYLIALQRGDVSALIFKKDDEIVIKRTPRQYRKKGDFLIIRNAKEVQIQTEIDDSTQTEGPSAYEIWLNIPGNEGKSPEEFIESLRNYETSS